TRVGRRPERVPDRWLWDNPARTSASALTTEPRGPAPGGAARHDHSSRLAAGEPIGPPAVRVTGGAILGRSLRARCAVEQSPEIPRCDPPEWRKRPVAAGAATLSRGRPRRHPELLSSLSSRA